MIFCKILLSEIYQKKNHLVQTTHPPIFCILTFLSDKLWHQKSLQVTKIFSILYF